MQNYLRRQQKEANEPVNNAFAQALSGIKEIRQLNAEEIKFMFEVVKFIAVQSAPILVKGRK